MNKRTGTYLSSLITLLLLVTMIPMRSIAQPAQKDLQGHDREKTFVHTDRGTYLTGETLWFSFYCIEAASNRPSTLSKVGYVELSGPGKNATVRAKVVLTNGNGNGYLNLPSYLPSGNYTLRGWTNWMRNFPDEGCHTGTITVINPSRKPEPVMTITQASPLAGIYPEGGHLIEGIPGRVACHVTDLEGNGLAVNGYLLRDRTDTVARFRTTSRGFGSFTLRPEPGRSYAVTLVTTDGRNGTYPLPAVEKTGYAFSLSEEAGRVTRVEARPAAGAPRETLTLVQLHGDRALRAWTARNNGQPVVWTIPIDSVPEGYTRYVLFDQEGQPIAERASFRRPQQGKLTIQGRLRREGYGNRESVDLDLSTISHMTPTPATLSVSVYKQDGMDSKAVDRMEEWLLLGSELRGRVQELSYYFSDSATNEATELLLLTQGWSAFRRTEGASPVLKFTPEYAGHLITGTVTRRSDGLPLKGIPAFISVQGKRFHFGSAVSDSNGRVSFDLKKIYGNGSIVIQTGVDSTAHLELDDPWRRSFPDVAVTPLRISPSLADTLRKAVLYQRAGLRTPETEHFYFPDATDSLPFFGQAEKTYLLDDYTRFRTMDKIFREYIPEVQVKRSKGSYELRVDHAPLPEFFSTDPLMLMDGVPYFNTDEVMNFDPLKIRKIEIVNRHYYQGSQDYSGIISMTSYEGDGGGIPLNPNAVLIEYEGLQLRREFPAPEYRTPEQLASRQPDFRRLLHWAPGIWTGEKGKAEVKFYTGDDKGKYIIVVQGLADDGAVGSSISEIVVK